MALATEPIGSIPRPLRLLEGIEARAQGDPIDPRVETPEEVCERVLQAAERIPLAQLGTTDDCGFSPFGDDVSTARETAFAKIRARVAGTQLASHDLGI